MIFNENTVNVVPFYFGVSTKYIVLTYRGYIVFHVRKNVVYKYSKITVIFTTFIFKQKNVKNVVKIGKTLKCGLIKNAKFINVYDNYCLSVCVCVCLFRRVERLLCTVM